MNQILQLCYLITISIAISALSIQVMARGKNLAANNQLVKSGITTLFLIFVVIFNFCDFLILFLGSSLGTGAVSWILVAEDLLEVWMAYVLIEMEREHFKLKERKAHFLFFTVISGLILWIEAAYTAGILFVGERVYMMLMIGLNSLPVLGIVLFTLFHLRKIIHPGWPSIIEGYFLFYNLVFFFLCLVLTIRIADARTETDFVVNDMELYAICGFVFNIMNFVLIWISCQTVGAEEARAEAKSAEALILQVGRECGLSDRELEIARLLCKGKNNNDIASDLFVSPNTVKVHTSNLYRKLGVKNRVQAVQALRGEPIDSEDNS